MRRQRGVEEGEEGGDVGLEAFFECCGVKIRMLGTKYGEIGVGGRTGCERADDEERVFEHGRCLTGCLDELDNEGHDAVREWLYAVSELADDALPSQVSPPPTDVVT